MLSAEFISFFLFCLGSMDPISLMFVLTSILTTLEGFEMESSPAIPLQSSSLLGS